VVNGAAAANSAGAANATIRGGRTSAPLHGRVRGTGVNAANHNARAGEDTAVLCNITEQSWILHRTHGMFVIPGREAGELFTLTPIGARTGAIDLGDKRTLEFPISAREIAEDLAREINSDGGEASYFGVFVCEGGDPSEQELAEARERLESFYRTLVAAADKQWERSHSVVFISDLERRAARELKFEKEWSYEPSQKIDCPACGEKLKPGVAVCRVCGAVLDRAKAAQFGLAVAAARDAAPSA
jgi:hypothetical protein